MTKPLSFKDLYINSPVKVCVGCYISAMELGKNENQDCARHKKPPSPPPTRKAINKFQRTNAWNGDIERNWANLEHSDGPQRNSQTENLKVCIYFKNQTNKHTKQKTRCVRNIT